MRRKSKKERQAPASSATRITPADIQQVEFRLAFRGYNERDVDAFLDRVTEDLSAYLEENQRLQTAPGLVRVADADPNEAAEIVARAREEAAEIVRRAEEAAAAIGAAAATGSGDVRAAVAPFLNKERAFLQGLGSLVQSHAEEIKEMVLAIRARTEQAQAAPQPSTDAGDEPAAAVAADPGAGSFEPASASEIRSRMGSDPDTVTLPEESAPDPGDAVALETATEPVYTTEGSPATDRRERSLRELFWGED